MIPVDKNIHFKEPGCLRSEGAVIILRRVANRHFQDDVDVVAQARKAHREWKRFFAPLIPECPKMSQKVLDLQR